MANWRHEIELNKVLSDLCDRFDLSRLEEPCPDEAKEALALEVTKAWPLRRFADRIRAAKSVAEVNRTLEQVFAEADASKVWCGMPG